MSYSLSSEPFAAGDVVKDVTAANFKAEVVDASQKALVLVDFLMAQEPSCRQLTDCLEKIARGAKGAVRLAKIDIDRAPAIAQQMGVRSVPSVFAFYQGRLLDSFAGAMPEAQIKTWVDQILKASGAGGEEKAGLEMAFQQAAEYLANGEGNTARAIYADILDMDPENARAYGGLIRCLLEEGKLVKAREMLNAAPAPIAKDKALDSLRAAVDLAEQVERSEGQSEKLEIALAQNPSDHQARFDLALTYYASGRNDEAVDHLLEIVRRARGWKDDEARKQLVKLFEAFGANDPLTVSARKRLSSILFS